MTPSLSFQLRGTRGVDEVDVANDVADELLGVEAGEEETVSFRTSSHFNAFMRSSLSSAACAAVSAST